MIFVLFFVNVLFFPPALCLYAKYMTGRNSYQAARAAAAAAADETAAATGSATKDTAVLTVARTSMYGDAAKVGQRTFTLCNSH
jgi:hypothetical protein